MGNGIWILVILIVSLGIFIIKKRKRAPARRALENNIITTLEQLSSYSEKEVRAFHGMGKSYILKTQKLLSDLGLSFKA
jgi:hypothetical protein